MRARRLVWAASLACALVGGAQSHAQAVEEIDRAVAELGRFVLRHVPDRSGSSVAVLPILSDRDGRVLLGDRLRGELELYLAAELSRTRTAQDAEGPRTYAVKTDLQVYPSVIRLQCRVYGPGGDLEGATRVDLPPTAELLGLLVSPPGDLVSPSGDLVSPSGDLVSPPGADAPGLDPYEPDEAPGFEAELSPPGAEGALYRRYLSPGDVDRFRLYKSDELPASLEVRSELDLQVLLYREGESLPFEVASSGRGGSLRLQLTGAEGYYIVELLAIDMNVQGPYTVELSQAAAADDGYEPDPSPEQGALLAPDSRQQRVLLPGDADWVRLPDGEPGFYALYVEDSEIEVRLAVHDANQRELLADEGADAFVGLFLGVRPTYARIGAVDPRRGGAYTLALERLSPRQVYADASAQSLPASARPEVLQLRIFQAGRYLVAGRAIGAPAAAPGPSLRLFSLPAMRSVQPLGEGDLYALAAGDYLLLAAGSRSSLPPLRRAPAALRLCVAPEAQADACRQRLAE